MKTILVVDDDPVSIRLIEMIAGRNGYATVAKSSGSDALAWLDTAESVEMVISDQRMDGMTGLEFYSAVHEDVRFRRLPFILCTGYADGPMVREAMRLGIKQFIVKPITPNVVLEKIAQVEAERPLLMAPRESTMVRLNLSDLEYKSLVRTSRERLADLREELTRAHQSGDRITTIMVASRLREPASLIEATRLLHAIDALESTRTWKDLDEAVRLALRETGELEVALEDETRPHLIGRSTGPLP